MAQLLNDHDSAQLSRASAGIATVLTAYGLHGLALWAEWRLHSAIGVVAVTVLITVLTCIIYSGFRFTRIRAKAPGISMEASHERRRRSSDARRPQVPEGEAA